MTRALEVTFKIQRTVRIEDRDAIALYYEDPEKLDDLILAMADRQQLGEDDELIRWTVEPDLDLPPLCGPAVPANECGPISTDETGPLDQTTQEVA